MAHFRIRLVLLEELALLAGIRLLQQVSIGEEVGNNIRSDTIVAHMKATFEEHGIPSKLVTGNDMPYFRNLAAPMDLST